MKTKYLLTNIYANHIRHPPLKLSLEHDGWEIISLLKDEHCLIDYGAPVDCLFVFNYPMNYTIKQHILSYKKKGIPLLVMMDDPLAFFDENINPFIEDILLVADRVFTSTDNMLPVYQSLGVKAEVMVGLANPQFDCPMPCDEENMQYDWGFIGTLTPQRFRFFWQLKKLLPDLKYSIVTQGLDHQGVINLIRKTRVNVVYGNYSDITDFKSNATTFRAWEFPYANAFILHDYRPQLFHYFREAESIVTFQSVEECAQLIQYYLDKPLERATIARNARQIIGQFPMTEVMPRLFNSLLNLR